METRYGQLVALAVPVFVALIALELAADSVRRTRYYRLADAVNSLSCGIVSTGMRLFFGFVGLFVYEALLARAPIQLPPNRWLTWVFAFVFYDFCYYWQHRLGHTVGLFWASHSVHHQSEEFNLTTALRQPGTGVFTNWVFYVPMALAGVPLEVFLLVGVTQLFYQFWPHTQLIGRLGWLDRWIQAFLQPPRPPRPKQCLSQIRTMSECSCFGTAGSAPFRRSATMCRASTAYAASCGVGIPCGPICITTR